MSPPYGASNLGILSKCILLFYFIARFTLIFQVAALMLF